MNEGATVGTRTFRDQEDSLFDELAVWQASTYSSSNRFFGGPNAERRLINAGERTTRIRGLEYSADHLPGVQPKIPRPHSCPTNEKSDHKKNDDFGAETGEVIVHVLIHGRKGEQEGVFPIRI